MPLVQSLPIELRRVRFAVFLYFVQKLRHYQDAANLGCLPKILSKSVTSAGGLGQQDVGHSGVAAGRGDLSLSSSIQPGFEPPLNGMHF